jgi:hypothetical protein
MAALFSLMRSLGSNPALGLNASQSPNQNCADRQRQKNSHLHLPLDAASDALFCEIVFFYVLNCRAVKREAEEDWKTAK